MPPETVDIAAWAKGLSADQRARLLSLRAEPSQMGIGMPHFLPGMVQADGLNHPIFGSHHRLTLLGQQVAAHLRKDASRG